VSRARKLFTPFFCEAKGKRGGAVRSFGPGKIKPGPSEQAGKQAIIAKYKFVAFLYRVISKDVINLDLQ
jgi:hypothetical protein